MQNLLNRVQEILLMGPGPSFVPDAVYDALSRKTIGHLDPVFLTIMDGIKEQLQQVMGTKNRLTIPISGTGSAGMETAFVNFIEPGDRILILINGVFGKRMADVASRLGGSVDTKEFDWGTPVLVEEVEKALKASTYEIVAVVHAETSTGVQNPIAAIGDLLKGTDSLYLVDAVTSLGGMEVAMDERGIDILYSGSQKCLSCPPGLAPVSVSERALDTLKKRKSKVPNWYLDLSMLINYWEGQKRVYHHTAPINMIYALYEALFLVIDEGIEKVFDRHMTNHRRLVAGLEDLGLQLFVTPEARLPMLNSVCVPDGVDEASVRSRLLNEFRIEIGAGLGPLAGKIWRIGLMGHTARPENVDRFLDAMRQTLGA